MSHLAEVVEDRDSDELTSREGGPAVWAVSSVFSYPSLQEGREEGRDEGGGRREEGGGRREEEGGRREEGGGRRET